MSKRSKFPCPMIARDWGEIKNPTTGKPIEGRKAITEAMKRAGARLVEPGEYLSDKVNRGKVEGSMSRKSRKWEKI